MNRYTPETNRQRREALYAFLLERGDRWTPSDLATASVNLYPPYFGDRYHSSLPSRLLSADIQAINASRDFDLVIISGNRGIKLATEAEYSRFLASELKEIFSKLGRVRKIVKKGSRHLQIDMEGRIAEAFLADGDG